MKPSEALAVVSRIVNNPANRGHRLAAFARFAAWQGYKRLARRHVDIRVFGGLTLRCYPDSSAASAVLYARSGLADYDEMSFLLRYLRPGDRFVDVGANVGIYTLLAASVVGRSGSITALEPDPSACARLRENVALNRLESVISAREIAASDSPGVASFTTGRDCTNRLDGDGERAVRCERLDDLLDAGPIAAIKVDVEGAEPLVLSGAIERIDRGDPPVWLLEINGLLRRFGWTEGDFESWLGERDYRLAHYDADANRLALSPGTWRRWPNSLAIYEPALDAVRERIA